jgi:8-amino-7-oxononanoate synthase
VEKVDAALAARETAAAVVVTDAVFSVDGDLAPLAALHEVCDRHGALLVVDEAHSLGVVGSGDAAGRGAVVAAGLSAAPNVVRTATLSKAFGAQGGAILAAPEIVDLLVNSARAFIFDTGLAPAAVGAAVAALRIVRDTPALPERARGNARQLAGVVAGLDLETTADPAAAVVPVVLGAPERALAAAAASLAAGVRVGCFRPPSVPAGRACLRLTARADLDAAALDRAAQALAGAVR